jgi:hypothetical protein
VPKQDKIIIWGFWLEKQRARMLKSKTGDVFDITSFSKKQLIIYRISKGTIFCPRAKKMVNLVLGAK